MIKKMKEFGKKPVTWGGYGKLCIIATVISVVIIIATYIYEVWVKLPKLKKKSKEIIDDTDVFEKGVDEFFETETES